MKLQLRNTLTMIAAFVFIFFSDACRADDEIIYDGVIEPNMVVDIGSSVESVVDLVRVERSQIVEKGEPLVILESSVEQATLRRAVLQAEIMGEILLEQEKLSFAQRSNDRVGNLFGSNAISSQQYDEAHTEVKLAAYRLQKA